MAGDGDDSEKTEEPTQKRIDDARKKGNIPKSQEVTSWFILLAGTLFIMLLAPRMASDLGHLLGAFLSNIHDVPMDGPDLLAFMRSLLWSVALIVALPLLLFWIAGLAGNVIQFPPIFTSETIRPKFSKISPMAGFKRLFSATSLVNFGKSLLKLVLVSVVIAAILWPRRDILAGALGLEAAGLPSLLRSLALKVLGGVLAIMLLIAGLDYGWQRHSWKKKLRMSLKEIKDEFKEQEGDPHIQARIRQIRMERAQPAAHDAGGSRCHRGHRQPHPFRRCPQI